VADSERPSTVRGPLHPVTRLGRLLQQIRSFTTLHVSELEGVAAELESAGQTELAARLRIFRDLHAQEAGLILDELADVQTGLDREAGVGGPAEPDQSVQQVESQSSVTEDPRLRAPESRSVGLDPDPSTVDPAVNSPKRARWLAEEARKAEEARRPRSRRDIFKRG